MDKYTSEKISDKYIELNSCGIENIWYYDCSCTRNNGRADYHILYISQGKCYAEIRGEQVILREGDILLYPPKQKQKYHFLAKDKAVSCYLHFSGTGCDEVLKECGFFPDLILHIGKNYTIEDIFKKMSYERSYKKTMYEKMMNIYLMELFIELIRINKEYHRNSSKKQTEIGKICKLMHEEYKISNSVSYYAKLCHLSSSRFHYSFKQYTGKSPIEYINDLRIERAKELLSNTDLSMSEIAEISGFCNQNYFSRIFKKKVGVSPKKFAELC